MYGEYDMAIFEKMTRFRISFFYCFIEPVLDIFRRNPLVNSQIITRVLLPILKFVEENWEDYKSGGNSFKTLALRNLLYEINSALIANAVNEESNGGPAAFANTPTAKESQRAIRIKHARGRTGDVSAISDMDSRAGPAISYNPRSGQMSVCVAALLTASQLKTIKNLNEMGNETDDSNSFSGQNRKYSIAKSFALKNHSSKMFNGRELEGELEERGFDNIISDTSPVLQNIPISVDNLYSMLNKLTACRSWKRVGF